MTAAAMPAAPAASRFIMTLQNTDVGYGKKTVGVSGRSPEIFVPMKAVDANPTFWKWPGGFVVDRKWLGAHAAWIASRKQKGRKPGRPLKKLDRVGVKFRTTHAGTVSATVWYNPDKVDVRIRHTKLRMAGQVGDILVLTLPSPGASFDYGFEVIKRSDPKHAVLDAQCEKKIPNSAKRFAYI